MATVVKSVANATSAYSKSPYRTEIDGLRALAVVAVIINHFNKDILPSGYLGVDIFFVISGFVITSSLAGRPSKNLGDFLMGFYTRRIKRLVPALVLFVVSTCAIAYFFIPAIMKETFDGCWRTGIASLFGLSNLYQLKNSTDYFATSTELNVFTHTWSLGVEEQFYFLFPFLVWFSGFGRLTAKGSRNLFWVIGSLSVASLIGFVYLHQTNQPAAYFLMPTRLWELGAGCLVFLGLKHSNRVLRILERVPPLLVTAGIVGVLFVPLQVAAVPVTVAVVVLTAVLITCLRPGTTGYKFFTHQRVVYIGLISYSLYLWHWGVLSISRWTMGIHWWSVPFQVALMLLLSIASYRYLERPLRRSNWSVLRWQSIGYGMGASISGVSFLMVLGMPLRGHLYTGNLNTETNENGRGFVPGTSISSDYCSLSATRNPITQQTLKTCTLSGSGVSSGNRFYILGDSHAGDLVGWISGMKGHPDHWIRMLNVHGTSSPPVPMLDSRKGDRPINAWYELGEGDAELQQYLLRITLESVRSGDVIVISNYLASFENIRISEQRAWLSSVGKLANLANVKGGNVVMVLPGPDFKKQQKAGDITFSNCTKQWFRPAIADHCRLQLSRKESLKNNRQIIDGLKDLVRRHSNLYLYDPFPVLCPTQQAYCSNYVGNSRIYWDGDHLNIAGSKLLYPDFLSFLRQYNLLKTPAI